MSINSFAMSMSAMSQDTERAESQSGKAKVTNKHMTRGQLRGIIPLFQHYFKRVDANGNPVDMGEADKAERWIAYKNHVWREYSRNVTIEYESEEQKIRRYSDPLVFIKWKLKRTKNLRVQDLSKRDYEWYKEIKGTDDVNELLERQKNIASMKSAAQKAKRRGRKRRRTIPTSPVCNPMGGNSNSHQPHVSMLNVSQDIPVIHMPELQSDAMSVSQGPVGESNPIVNVDRKPRFGIALDKINGHMDLFEQSKLSKQKIETFEITQEKLKALFSISKSVIIEQPALIGLIPGCGCMNDQLLMAFHLWMDQNKTIIQGTVVDFQDCLRKLMLSELDQEQKSDFLSEWKVIRIFKADDFKDVWQWVCTKLQIELKPEVAAEEELRL